MKTELTIRELKFISHTLGINLLHSVGSSLKRDRTLPKVFYRNYYVSNTVEEFHTLLEEKGLVASRKQYGQHVMHCTDKAKELFRKDFQTLVPYVTKRYRGSLYYTKQIQAYCYYCDYTHTVESLLESYKKYYLQGDYMSHTTKGVIERFKTQFAYLHKNS